MRVILVSHCDLLGNSAMHVFSMAEELQALHHDVIMLLPDALETIQRHRRPTFPIRTYKQALEGDLPFRSGNRAEIIHAWTPREHVRKVTLQLVETHSCPYLLHMEDNEEQIITDEMKNLDFRGLSQLPLLYQDLMTPPNYRSHPTHYRAFANGASGYTCVIERLLEFKPDHVAGAVFWPGFDNEFEHLPTDARSKHAQYGLAADDIIIFYSGNVHHSIVGDVRNLYLAVSALRARGRKLRLMRTGWNHAEINLPKDKRSSEFFVELGFLDRAELPTLLAMSDLLIQPGRSDLFNDYRFPSKLPEYLVSGKPVILPACNIADALEEGRHVLKLYDGTLLELIGKIEQILDDPALGERLGAEARAFAVEHLRWSRAAKIVSDLYAQVVAAPQKVGHDQNMRSTEPTRSCEHPVKLIAFYLPQFHQIRENDEWWGKGFTEWTNVSTAEPQMFGHRQPRVPTELSYYDLRNVKTMHEQAKLATEYGVSGFCFYIYWFNGRRLLERPIDLWLNKGPDFPFCVSWANENWSRRWDGSDTEILMAQEYNPGFEESFIIDMLPVLKDPRYIKVQDAPLLLIYRVDEFPDPVASAEALRAAAAKHGIPDVHLVATQSFGVDDPRSYGFDAAVEFPPPHVNRLLLDPHTIGGVYSGFDGYVEDYVGVANESINARQPQYVRYRGCFPMWDNTARRKSRGHIFVNDSPKAYGRWLRFLVEEAMLRRDQIEPLIFINAWNEWAEGTYLEPDENYGRALLEVTRAALAHGVADYALGGASPQRERQFTLSVSRLPWFSRRRELKRFPSKANALAFLKDIGVRFGAILDVGTHQETPELKQAFPANRHVLFEPTSEFFARIAANYAGLDWELVPVAVSDSDGEGKLRKIAITGGEISHAKLELDATDKQDVAPGDLGISRVDLDISSVRTIRLDTFLKQRDEPRPYLLKVDVDGFELRILRGAEGIWSDIDCIIVEATSDTFLERLQFIMTRGFRLFDIVDQCYYAGTVSQVDLIFVSDRLYLSNPRLRPWATQEFTWEKWVPVADYERYLPGDNQL
jgi:FkbM family methyltransferase